MVKLRLKRGGTKKRPFYHVVAVDSRQKRDGSVIETVGFYNPLDNNEPYRFKEDRVMYWHSVGAKSTDTVYQLLIKAGIASKLRKGYTPEANTEAQNSTEANTAEAQSEQTDSQPTQTAESAPESTESASTTNGAQEPAPEKA